MGIFDSFEISASGMTAQRDQMDLISSNIANVNTTHTVAGGPYRRQMALFQEKIDFNEYFTTAAFSFDDGNSEDHTIGSGVSAAGVVKDPSPLKKVYDPHNPDADEHGYVSMPNVDLITEMTNMIQASRAYEANATAIDATKAMLNKAIDIQR